LEVWKCLPASMLNAFFFFLLVLVLDV
jgi:hypothetical protein